MALKTFCFSLWMFFISFTLVKGSCLEYGHSCWGAHGKRSGNNKIYRTDLKTPIEVDFQDFTGLKEKSTYDSTEEHMNDGAIDAFSSSSDMIKDNDEHIGRSDRDSIKLKKILYKKLNKYNGDHRNLEVPENPAIKSNSLYGNSERWRRLPLYNIRSVKITRPDNEWLKELEQEQQINGNDYI